MCQYSVHGHAILSRSGVWIPGPGGQIGLKPLPRLLTPASPHCLTQLRSILTLSHAGQDGSDGSDVAESRSHVVTHSWLSRDRIGVQSRGRRKLPLDATEVSEVKAFGCIDGPVFALEYGLEPAFQTEQPLTALHLAGQVCTSVITLGGQVEAATGGRQGFAEVPLGEQHLAQGPMGQVQLGVDSEGLAEVIDHLGETVFALGDTTEVVVGRSPVGVESKGLLVVVKGIVQREPEVPVVEPNIPGSVEASSPVTLLGVVQTALG